MCCWCSYGLEMSCDKQEKGWCWEFYWQTFISLFMLVLNIRWNGKKFARTSYYVWGNWHTLWLLKCFCYGLCWQKRGLVCRLDSCLQDIAGEFLLLNAGKLELTWAVQLLVWSLRNAARFHIQPPFSPFLIFKHQSSSDETSDCIWRQRLPQPEINFRNCLASDSISSAYTTQQPYRGERNSSRLNLNKWKFLSAATPARLSWKQISDKENKETKLLKRKSIASSW